MGLLLLVLVLSVIIVIGFLRPDLLVNLYFDKEPNATWVWRSMRLPNTTQPLHYTIQIDTYLEPEWKFNGESYIDIRVCLEFEAAINTNADSTINGIYRDKCDLAGY